MTLRRNVLSVVSALGLAAAAVPSVALADASCSTADVLADAQLVRVLRADKQFHKVTMNLPAGVELFVPAEPGMSAAWIERATDCATYEGDHPLAVEGARAEVREARGGYLVRITSPDRDDAREVIRRAESTYSR